MKINASNGFSAGVPQAAGAKRPARPGGPANEGADRAGATLQRLEAQKQRHLSFLVRLREGMTFYMEKMEAAHETIQQYKDFQGEEFQAMVTEAQNAIPECEAMLEELQQTLDNGIQENTFILGTLEALLNGGGRFPVHTLEAYMQKREEEPADEAGTAPRYKRYTLEGVDGMIADLKKELGRTGFSAKA